MILEPLHFGAFLLSKKGIKNCIQAKPTISQARLPACFLCSHANPLFLFHPISKPPQLIEIDPDCHVSGNFKLVSLIFNWSPLDNNFKKHEPIWGDHLCTKNWLVGDCLLFVSLMIISFSDEYILVLKVLMRLSGENDVSQFLAICHNCSNYALNMCLMMSFLAPSTSFGWDFKLFFVHCCSCILQDWGLGSLSPYLWPLWR